MSENLISKGSKEIDSQSQNNEASITYHGVVCPKHGVSIGNRCRFKHCRRVATQSQRQHHFAQNLTVPPTMPSIESIAIGGTVNINGRMVHWDGEELLDLQTKTKFLPHLPFCQIDGTTRWARPHLIIDKQSVELRLQRRPRVIVSQHMEREQRMFKFSEELSYEGGF